MSTDFSHPVLEFLTTAPPDFEGKSPYADGRYTGAQVARNDLSTGTWRKDMLSGAVLGSVPVGWELEFGQPFKTEVRRWNSDGWKTLYVPGLACQYPRGTQDLVDAVSNEILRPVLNIARDDRFSQRWVPSSDYPRLDTKGLQFRAEVVGESYGDRPDGATPVFRFDRLFVINAWGTGYTASTREGSKAASSHSVLHGNDTVRSARKYLRRGDIWAVGELQGQSLTEIQNTCKTMLPVHVVSAGTLNEHVFTWLGRNGVKLGQPDDNLLSKLQNDKLSLSGDSDAAGAGDLQDVLAAIADAVSTISEALRHSVHYGADIMLITDYEQGVLLRVPQQLHHSVLNEEVPVAIGWDFVPKGQLRLAVAATFWGACRAMTKTLEDFERIAEEEAKADV